MTAVAAVLLAALGAAQPPLSPLEYAARLDAIRTDLEEGRLAAARGAAEALEDRTFAWNDETLATDAPLLGEVLAVRGADRADELAQRVGRLATAVRAPATRDPRIAADPDLLARLTPRDRLTPGGDVPRLELEPVTLPERLAAALWGAIDWIGEQIGRLIDWLLALRPEGARRPTSAPGRTAVTAIAFAVAVAAVLGWLVLRARRGRLPPPERAAPVSRAEAERDADPLSREASGWERRAAELAAARRFREAVRAWYHAVLVALFQSGRLHHQKGRTNWEYAARLDPRLPWRPTFLELTQLFDREWYGRRRSDAAALAECARQARAILTAVRRGDRAA